MFALAQFMSIPLSLLALPFVAISLMIDSARSTVRERAFQREADLAVKAVKLEGRRTVRSFQEDLRAMDELRLTFVSRVRTPAEARIAWRLLDHHRRELLRRRAAIS